MITTILYDYEMNVPLQNGELQRTLDFIRAKSNMNWQVVARELLVKKKAWQFFRKHRKKTMYEVYVEVGGVLPWQLLNFMNGTYLTEPELGAYLMGLKNGWEMKEYVEHDTK